MLKAKAPCFQLRAKAYFARLCALSKKPSIWFCFWENAVDVWSEEMRQSQYVSSLPKERTWEEFNPNKEKRNLIKSKSDFLANLERTQPQRKVRLFDIHDKLLVL